MLPTRIVISIYGALFAVLGLGFWFAPELVAQRFNVAALGTEGFSTLRADFGGLFLALSALCLFGVWRRWRAALAAAAVILSAIVAGRLIGLAFGGSLVGLRVTLPMEIMAIVAIAVHLRATRGSAAPSSRPRLPRIALIGGGVVAALVVGVTAALLSPPLQAAAFDRLSAQQLRRADASVMADDALRVAVCGSSSPLPSEKRAKACVAVIAGGKIYVVDTGPESVERLATWGVPMSRVAGVFITHFHSDHIGDLGELNLQTWAQGRPAQLPVYGGPGIERVVAGFNEAYAQDQVYRTEHHTPQRMPAETWAMVARPVPLAGEATAQKSRTALVFDDGALRVTAIELDHAPVAPAYAYRFDYKGRSVVITGDTKAHRPLARASRGVDLMVSEALARQMVETLERNAHAAGRDRVGAIMDDIQSYHVSPTEAAEVANEAGAQMLVLYHLIPAPDNLLTRRVFARGMNQTRKGDWHMADDGSLYTLPLGTDEIRVGRIGG